MLCYLLPLWMRSMAAGANAGRYRVGQGLVEYALILSLVVLVVIGILGMLARIIHERIRVGVRTCHKY